MTEHCFFCGQRILADLDGRCARCGALRTTSPEKRVRARCPRCHEVRLSPFALGPIALHVCGRCKGAFLPTTEWDALLETFEHEPLHEIMLPDEAVEEVASRRPYREADVPSSVPRSTDDRAEPVSCPTCDEPMERVEFAGISRVIIDVCRSHGVWLDHGEIEGVIASMQERPSKATPLPPAAVHKPTSTSRTPPVDYVASLDQALRESAGVHGTIAREPAPPWTPFPPKPSGGTEPTPSSATAWVLRSFRAIVRWLRA